MVTATEAQERRRAQQRRHRQDFGDLKSRQQDEIAQFRDGIASRRDDLRNMSDGERAFVKAQQHRQREELTLRHAKERKNLAKRHEQELGNLIASLGISVST